MRASAGSAVWAVNHNLRHRDLFVSLSTQRSGWREIVLLGLLRPLALPQSHAWAASVLVDEFDASKLEGFPDSLNRLTRYWPSEPFKIDDRKSQPRYRRQCWLRGM
jgi:hypothetical protein